MNLEVLKGLYEQDARIKQIAAQLVQPGEKNVFSLTQLYGSATGFIANAVYQLTTGHHVFVVNDAEEAAYMQNDLQQLSEALDVFYFPDSFKKSGNYNELNSSHLMLRTEALLRLSQKQAKKHNRGNGILVTYPEALMEKVVRTTSLNEQLIHLKVSESLSIDALFERLVNLGFKREDFVYEPGQFAMRGGILDIYSYGNEKPYRIEMFGDDIDSIRLFNPESQLSERKLLQVSIIPNIETEFNSTERVPLTSFLPDDTVFWFKDYAYCQSRLEKLYGELLEKLSANTFAISTDDDKAITLSGADFVSAGQLQLHLQERQIVSFSTTNLTPYFPAHQHQTFAFSTEEQPVFNRNFDLLIADLKKRDQQKTAIFIFSDNAKQLERLRSIFEDLKADLNFYPIPTAISKGFIDHDKNVVCFTDHQIFQRYHKYKVKQAYSKGQAITKKILRELQPGDYVTHIDHGVGTYSGLQKIEVNGRMQEAVRLIYRDSDVLYVNINSLHKISKYSGKEGHVPRINKLGSDAWSKLKHKTRQHVKDIAADLIKLYARRKASQGFSFTPDSYLQTELEASFIYEDTPDQSKATNDVKRDMEAPSPMDRLICGDVGFGKTEIAIRAAFKAVADSKQVAILVPTTILAFQHFQTISERLKNFPATVDFINRFKSTKQKNETLRQLRDGKIDIVIGTHALLSKDIEFKDLGLLIVDEEQKFGVAAKEKLRALRANVDTLILTATPIPRTLQFSLMNARDLSIINTPPPNRQPVETEIMTFDEIAIRDAIYYEAERGGQIFFVHNRVQSLPEMTQLIRNLCPDLEVGMAHGQMEGKQLEDALLQFIERKYDVLCCTNIVESGVDIPNANTIIINNAHHFGLSDLHQLRGRVGRSNKKAFCYLIAPSLATLPNESRRRLQTLEQFNELGSGFQIAMRDLDIRGAGNLLGAEQSGFIAEIGFDMYQKILAEAIHDLKATDFKEVFKEELARKQNYVQDCSIDTDLEILIPEEYVSNTNERLALYTQLDNMNDEPHLQRFARQLQDRFGPIPPPVIELMDTVRCRSLGISLGFEKMILKNNQLRLYFLNQPDSAYFESEIFNSLMQYLQKGTNKIVLKQSGKNFLLLIPNVTSMRIALGYLEELHHATIPEKEV